MTGTGGEQMGLPTPLLCMVLSGMKLSLGRFRVVMGKRFFPRGWWDTEHIPQGSGHSPRLHRAQGMSEQRSQEQGGILRVFCAGPGLGPKDPCVSLPNQDIPQFYDSTVLPC